MFDLNRLTVKCVFMILDSDTCIYIYHVLFDVNYRYNEMQTFSEHEYFMCGKTYI